VCGDDEALPGANGGRDYFVPIRQNAGDGVFQALGQGNVFFVEARVARVFGGRPLVVGSSAGGGTS